jgi:hypothetical protein
MPDAKFCLICYGSCMKALALAFTLLMVIFSCTAQTNDLDLALATQAQTASLKVHRTLMQRIFGMNVSYGGVLMPRSKMRRAFVSTNAPALPFHNVSVHPITGRAEGLQLLSIRF